MTEPTLGHVNDCVQFTDAEFFLRGNEYTNERVSCLVGKCREDIEFDIYLCLSDRCFECAEFVEPTLDILAATLPEFVVEIASKSIRRLCHRHLVEYFLN